MPGPDFGTGTPLSDLQFEAIRKILSRSPFYTDDNTFLRIKFIASTGNVTLIVAVRQSKTDGTLIPQQFQLKSAGPFVVTQQDFELAEGIIHSMVAYTQSTMTPTNHLWLVVQLMQSSGPVATALAALAEGHIYSDEALYWPGSLQLGPLDGPGQARDIAVAAPAAGVNPLLGPSLNTRVVVDAFFFQFITAAGGGNRAVQVQIDKGAGNTFLIPAAFAQAAGLAFNYVFAPNLQPYTVVVGIGSPGPPPMPLPIDLFLQGPLQNISTVTNNIGLSDTFVNIIVSWREWFLLP